MKFIEFIFDRNGREKTMRDLGILSVAPWAIFLLAVVINALVALVKEVGVGAQFTSIPVVAIGCSIFSFYNVVLYFWKWWGIFTGLPHSE